MQFSLVICTYMRVDSLISLLNSIKLQTKYPDEILIIDGSEDDATSELFLNQEFKNLTYYKVRPEHRGLTKQRNYGILKVSKDIKVVCFLDDDVILEKDYFSNLIGIYKTMPKAAGVGGYISNEVLWKKGVMKSSNYFLYDGWYRKEPLRFRVRKIFGLAPDKSPGYLPDFSHGRSISFLPPSGKIYQVEQLMGGVSSFKKEIFKEFQFSKYFEGYGLYEDADFTLRVSKKYDLFVNTSARLSHFHAESGRPNYFSYGKMVSRNGWYVWRIKNPKPTVKSRLKWHFTTILLMKFRFLNILTGPKRKEAFIESWGRFWGWISLLFNAPKLESDKF